MGRKFALCAITEDIENWPRDKDVKRAWVQAYYFSSAEKRDLELPEFVVHFSLHRAESETKFSGHTDWMHAHDTLPLDHPLHLKSLDELKVEVFSSSPDLNEPDTPLLLLRITDPETPGRGLVVWLEDRLPDPATGR